MRHDIGAFLVVIVFHFDFNGAAPWVSPSALILKLQPHDIEASSCAFRYQKLQSFAFDPITYLISSCCISSN